MELFGPDGQNDSFSMSKEPRACKPPHFTDFHLALTAKMTHFQSQMIPGADKSPILPIFVCYSSPSFLVIRNSYFIIFFGDPEFRRYFCHNFSWTSAKTLAIESLALTAKTTHFKGQTSPEAVSPDSQIGPISRSNKPRSRSQLALTAKTTHFKGQTNLKASKLLILPISVCYSPWMFCDLECRRHFCRREGRLGEEGGGSSPRDRTPQGRTGGIASGMDYSRSGGGPRLGAGRLEARCSACTASRSGEGTCLGAGRLEGRRGYSPRGRAGVLASG
ncbi:hypothetical protein H5410_060157 [Solanum commersonii]|uniref:Uncharacterized protein n=1 Tax=Solanum commersonii TaxID=4109 RepID=A0A9J5W4T1_SOLCO|nr:hypothetical protein H5410_060157 [Solanum commersonii]